METQSMIPGHKSRIFFSSSEYFVTYESKSGRGAAKLIFPKSMLISCEISLILHLRINLPLRVILLSLFAVEVRHFLSASTTIERNL
jgi:hypothetical protein